MLKFTSITGFEAFQLATKAIFPNGGTIWVKTGHSTFYQGEIPQDKLTLRETHLNLPSGDDYRSYSRSISIDPIKDGYSHLRQVSESKDGGVFFLNGKPQDYPLKESCQASNVIIAEIDDLSFDEQKAVISQFSEISGLIPALITSSGGKSLHPMLLGAEDFTTDQAVFLKRLFCIALLSDPAVIRPHQPIRLAGFFRKEKGKEQSLEFYSGNKYSYDELISGFKCYFTSKGYKFPEQITDEWWGIIQGIIKGKKGELGNREAKESALREALLIGLDGYQAKREREAKEREQRRLNRKITGITGETNLIELIDQVNRDLGEDGFGYGHDWKGNNSKKRGYCQWHDTKSNSAWLTTDSDGVSRFHCPTCTGDKGITAFNYWLFETRRVSDPCDRYPTGKDFVEAAKAFLSENGVTVPDIEFKPKYSEPDQAFFEYLKEQERVESAIATEENYSDLITQLEKLPTEQSAYPKGRIHLGTPRQWKTWEGGEISGNALEIPKNINIAHLTTQALRQDISIILRSDEAGTGKTYDSLYNIVIPEYIPDEDEDEGKENDEPKSGKAYILTTRNPYNFPIKLPENVGIRPSRHGEIIREDGTIIPSNCVHTDLIGKTREKNLGGAGWACNGCVYRKECETKEGAESDLPCGYLYENKLERNKDALLCQVDSFLGEIEGGIDTQNTGIIADEFEEMIPHLKTTKLISKTEAEATFWKFREQEVFLPLFEKITELINRASSQKERYFKLETDEIISELKEVLTDEMIDHLNEVYFDIETLLKESGLYDQDLSWENFVNAEDWDVDQPRLDEINSELMAIRGAYNTQDKLSDEEVSKLQKELETLKAQRDEIKSNYKNKCNAIKARLEENLNDDERIDLINSLQPLKVEYKKSLQEVNKQINSVKGILKRNEEKPDNLDETKANLKQREQKLLDKKATIEQKREVLKAEALETAKHYQKNRLSEQREKIFEIINNSPPNWIYGFILKVASFIKNTEDVQQPKLIIEIDKRGTILIEYPRQNLINTLKNARYLQALSATLDPQEMAWVLGITEDKILQIRRPLSDKSNKTTNIYPIAPNSNQWTDNDLKRMKSALEKLTPDGEDIPVFAPKKLVKQLGVNRWYGCHDVGSNLDQGQTRTISIGELFIDRGALERQYKLLGGNPEQFENYYLYKMQNRIYQRHERDRSHRYPDQEFVTDILAPSKMDYSFLSEWGYQPIIHPANALGEEVIPSKQRKKHSIFTAIENRIRQGLKVTQTIIGKICDCSQAWISMVASRYGGWKRLVNAIRLLIEDEKNNGKLTKNALENFEPEYREYYQHYAQERASFLENAVKDIKFLDQEKISQIVSIILSIYSRKDALWGVVISLLAKEVKDKLITVFFSFLPTIKPYTVYDTA